jgi:hypothetical protein
LTILLSGLLRFTDYDYPFGIFKLFLQKETPKIGKNMIFWRKIVIFHTKYLKHFRASLGNRKNIIFWRKIVIFHTKYLKNFRASLCSAVVFSTQKHMYPMFSISGLLQMITDMFQGQIQDFKLGEERTGKCLRRVEHGGSAHHPPP